MNAELYWLALTALMTACFWIPYILNRMMVRGVMGAMANPSPDLKAQPEWAERAKAAHANGIENLVVFATLVLVANAAGITGGMVATAAIIYFWARLAHFIVYTLGIPVARTLSFLIGFVAQVMVAIAIVSG